MNNGGGVTIPLYTYAYALQLLPPTLHLHLRLLLPPPLYTYAYTLQLSPSSHSSPSTKKFSSPLDKQFQI
jgi:hypothetical protein